MRRPLRALSAFDDAVDRVFRRLRGVDPIDRIYYVASEAADYSLGWHVISATMAAVSPSRRRDALRLAVALGLESILVNGILKQLTRRQRPALLDDRAYEVRRPSTTSFPSGHASSASMSAVLLSDTLPAGRPLWISLAAIVATSRIHNRMHHASDVLAGALLGTALGLLTKRVWPLRSADGRRG